MRILLIALVFGIVGCGSEEIDYDPAEEDYEGPAEIEIEDIRTTADECLAKPCALRTRD